MANRCLGGITIVFDAKNQGVARWYESYGVISVTVRFSPHCN
jgi:hypothetical protein